MHDMAVAFRDHEIRDLTEPTLATRQHHFCRGQSSIRCSAALLDPAAMSSAPVFVFCLASLAGAAIGRTVTCRLQVHEYLRGRSDDMSVAHMK